MGKKLLAQGIANKNRIVMLNLISTIILQGITFISAPIFSNILGTANYGAISVYNTWVSIFSTVLTLQATGTIVIARANFPLEDQEKYQSSVLSLAVLLYFSFSVVLLAFFRSHESLLGLKEGLLPIALVQGIGHYCVGTLNGKNTYEFKAGRNLALTVSSSVVNIGLSLILVYNMPTEQNHIGRAVGQSATYLVFGLFSYLYIFVKGKTFYNKEYWKFTLPITIPTVFHLLAGLVLGQSDRLMLQQLLSDSSVGIYTLSATFCTAISSIWSALNTSWAPFYYEYTRLTQIEEMRLHAKNYIQLFTGIVCGFILLSPEVFHVFAGKEYWGGTAFIPLFVIGHYFVFLYSFPVNFEFFYKKTKLIAIATTIAAVINVILNYVLIINIGIIGAVLATAIAHGVQFLSHFLFAKGIVHEAFPFHMKDFALDLFILGMSVVVFYVLPDAFIVRWFLGACIGVFLMNRMWMRKSIF